MRPQRRPCSAITAGDQPCRAWAVHDTDPPLCSIHAGRNRPASPDQPGPGAPPGNQNRTTHGFYASVLHRDEVLDLLDHAGVGTLEGEIACARIALRRVLAYLAGDHPDPDAVDPHPLTALEYARLAALVFQGTRTIAHLIRAYQAGGGVPDDLQAAVDHALTALAKEWNIEL